MKKHLSVLMLIARSSIYKLLGILLCMAAAEGILFYLTLERVLGAKKAGSAPTGLETLFTSSRVAWVCAVAFILLAIILCLTGCEFGSKQGYTLRRLAISKRSIFLWQSFYNTLCFFLFLAAQLFIVLALSRLYMARANEAVINGQTVFLAFYRNSFLHSLLPLEEGSRYVRNVILMIGLGISSAAFPIRQRNGKLGLEIIALVPFCIVFFAYSMGSFASDMLVIMITFILALEVMVSMCRRGSVNEA